MELAHRQGSDGSNENVHNFLINILARGGVLSLIPFLTFVSFLLIISKKISKNNLIIIYIISVIIISFLMQQMKVLGIHLFFILFWGIILIIYLKLIDLNYQNRFIRLILVL